MPTSPLTITQRTKTASQSDYSNNHFTSIPNIMLPKTSRASSSNIRSMLNIAQPNNTDSDMGPLQLRRDDTETGSSRQSSSAISLSSTSTDSSAALALLHSLPRRGTTGSINSQQIWKPHAVPMTTGSPPLSPQSRSLFAPTPMNSPAKAAQQVSVTSISSLTRGNR